MWAFSLPFIVGLIFTIRYRKTTRWTALLFCGFLIVSLELSARDLFPALENLLRTFQIPLLYEIVRDLRNLVLENYSASTQVIIAGFSLITAGIGMIMRKLETKTAFDQFTESIRTETNITSQGATGSNTLPHEQLAALNTNQTRTNTYTPTTHWPFQIAATTNSYQSGTQAVQPENRVADKYADAVAEQTEIVMSSKTG